MYFSTSFPLILCLVALEYALLWAQSKQHAFAFSDTVCSVSNGMLAVLAATVKPPLTAALYTHVYHQVRDLLHRTIRLRVQIALNVFRNIDICWFINIL